VRLVTAALAIALTACGNKSENATASCAAAAQTSIDAMVKRARERVTSAQLPPEVRMRLEERTVKLEQMAPRLEAVITNRCVDDKWPADVIACYGKASSMDELRACRGKLSPDQQAKVQREELDLFASAGGPPGFGPQGAAAAAAAAAASPDVTRYETEVRRLNERLAEAQKKIDAATNDVDRQVAQKELLRYQQELEAVNKALESARADAVRAGSANAAAVGSATK
jgi:hypothetical protein